MSKIIKKNLFGYIFFSHANNSIHKNEEDITKLQKINFETKVELTMRDLIEKIPLWEKYYSIITPECCVQLKNTKEGILAECDYSEEKLNEYILLNIPSNSTHYFFEKINFKHDVQTKNISRYILNLIDSYKYLFVAVKKLVNAGIVHLNINNKTIIMDFVKKTPRLSQFKKAIAVGIVSIDELKPYFHTSSDRICNSENWPLEVCTIYYLLWLNASVQTLTKSDIDAIILFYTKNDKIMQTFSSEKQKEYTKSCYDFLIQFIHKDRETIISELFQAWNTWDMYAISYIFIEYCNFIAKHTITKAQKHILDSFKSILQKHICLNPLKRSSIENTECNLKCLC